MASDHLARAYARLLIAMSAALVAVSVVAIILVARSRDDVRSARAIVHSTVARSLAETSMRHADSPRLQALLALESFRIDRGTTERSAVIQALATVPSSQAVLKGAGGAVADIQFGAGHQLVTSSADDTVRYWDADRGVLTRADDVAGSGRFAIGPKALVMSGSSGRVTYRPAGYGHAPKTGRLDVVDVVLSPDGTTAATANRDGTIAFFRLLAAGVAQIGRWIKVPGSASAVAYDPAGRVLYAVGKTGLVRRWNVATHAEILPAHRVTDFDVVHDALTAIAVNPKTGELAVGGSQQRVYLLDARGNPTGHIQGTQGPAAVSALAFSPDGTHLAVGGATGLVEIWRAADLVPVNPPVPAHTGVINAVSFSRDGKLLASAGDDGVARVWRVGAPGVETMASHASDLVSSLALDRTGATVASGSTDGSIRVWRARGGSSVEVRKALTGENDSYRGVLSVSLSSDGRLLIASEREQQGDKTSFWAEGWDVTRSPKLLWRRMLGTDDAATAIAALSPDGSLAAVTYYSTLELLEARTGKPRWRSGGDGEEVDGLAFSPDSATLATSHADGKVLLWHARDGKLQQTLDEQLGDPAYGVAISHSGKLLAVAEYNDSQEGRITLWARGADGFAPRSVRTIRDTSADPLAFSPDDTTLAGLDLYGPLSVWDVATGRLIAKLESGSAGGQALAWAGPTLVTGHDDGLVGIWDTSALAPTLTRATGRLCRYARPALSRAEWRAYLPGRPFAPLCR
jgi:WD40 repeat protein